MFVRAILAIIVAVAVALICILLGGILNSINAPIIEPIGEFLHNWGWVIGALAGLWYFFSGNFPTGRV